ncbi:MAG: filamentous hemagglutinin N-terminal domain-containing protein [Alphaproteobacteria bacterium]
MRRSFVIRGILWLTTLCYGAVICAPASLANPEGGIVSAGSATITSSGTTTTIRQQSDRAVIDWRGFDIAPNETTKFIQPSSGAMVLNRVNGNSATQIDGALQSNGQVIVVNQNGVMFGRTANVDVAGITATSANISNSQFMTQQNPAFDQPGKADATVSNAGTITAKDAGLVGLVAPQVTNSGTITAKLGRVTMASGDSFTLDLAGDGITQIAVNGSVNAQLVRNDGTVNANGGTIRLTAAAARGAVNSLVENNGTLKAHSIGVHNGVITLFAAGQTAVASSDSVASRTVAANSAKKTGGTSTVRNRGTIDVSGMRKGETGGTVELTADKVEVLSGSVINANGNAGAGQIHIGGDFHGAATIPTALTTLVAAGALITADATRSGDGGQVSVWAEESTTVGGRIEASAENNTGNGGLIETSGGNVAIEVEAQIVAESRRRRSGTWLLDPADLVIDGTDANSTTEAGTPSAGTNTYIPDGTVTASHISATTIDGILNAGTNVVLSTGADGAGGNGDIMVNAAISSTAGTLTGGATQSGNLTLSAYRDITVGASITLDGGSLTLRSNNAGAADGSTGVGSIYITYGVTIKTNGGDITIGGGSGAIGEGVGFAVGDANSSYDGVYFNGGGVDASGTTRGGTIIINGVGGNPASGTVYDVSTGATTNHGGNIAITGKGGTSSGSVVGSPAAPMPTRAISTSPATASTRASI